MITVCYMFNINILEVSNILEIYCVRDPDVIDSAGRFVAFPGICCICVFPCFVDVCKVPVFEEGEDWDLWLPRLSYCYWC